MPQNQPWLQFFPKDELSNTAISILTGDQYMLFMKFRQAAFINGPLPDNELILEKIAYTFNLSRYKFRKNWPIVKTFFEKTFEGFQYPEDEEKRNQRLVVVAKRQMAGMLGAEARWGIKGTISMANGMANAWQTSPPEPQPEPYTQVEEPPPPTPSSDPVFDPVPTAGGGGPIRPSDSQTQENPVDQQLEAEPKPELRLTNPLTPNEFRAICSRAIELHMGVPGYKLASQVRQKFPNLEIDQIIPLLVRWPGQVQAGLWKTKSPADFELEAARQAHQPSGPPRKLSASEQQFERMMARAKERDQAAGVG